jgi:hypothetical protein
VGICCGDLVAAKRALDIFEFIGHVIPDDALRPLIRSIQIVSAALMERTDPSKSQYLGAEWRIRVVEDDRPSQYADIIVFLGAALKVVIT